jgi:tetratricopeptide (TPR) repeat protein
MLELIRRAALVMLVLATTGAAAAAQEGGSSRDSISIAAAQLLDQGRVNEARILLLKAMRASTDPTQQAEYRLRVAATFLYQGQYDEAAREYNAVLRAKVPPQAAQARAAHHGLALVEAFNGRSTRAATHYAEALRGATLRDTVEMLVMTNQNDSAMKALDRLAASSADPQTRQYVQAFRGLSWMMAGHCTEALPQLAKAPQQDRPLIVAVQGRCAMKHGQRPEALAMKDAVLKQPMPDPFAWPMLIARDTARKIE